MRRALGYFLAFTLILIALGALFGTRLLEQTLDAELPGLLSRELGIDVSLAPLKVNVLRLSASSPHLVMGDAKNPAILASDVEVSLSIPDLLERKIRLATASAGSLTVEPSRWPGNDSPWPTDYRFLDQWLPSSLQLEQGTYVASETKSWPVKQLHWQRQSDGGVDLGATTALNNKPVAITGQLQSLDELLQLNRLRVQLTTTPAGVQASKIDLAVDLQPGTNGGYTLSGHAEAIGIELKLQATNSQAWKFPDRSTSTIDDLNVTKLRQLIASYDGSDSSQDAKAMLASELPRLAWPSHRGTIAIAVLQFDQERTTDNSFNFVTSGDGVSISALRASGPAGTLQGDGNVVSNEQGWQVTIKADIKAKQQEQSLAGQFMNSQWLWHDGQANINGNGSSWGQLLDSLKGNINAAGSHRGAVNTPVSISARIGNNAREFTLEDMEVHAGTGIITGTISLSGTDQRLLKMDLSGEKLDLEFLFQEPGSSKPQPGLAMPEFLITLPGIDLDWKLDLKDIQLPGIEIHAIRGSLSRTPTSSKMVAAIIGADEGTLDLELDATTPEGRPSDVNLSARFTKFDIPGLFERELATLDSRSTGTIRSESTGNGLATVFEQLRGKAELDIEIRTDGDWSRPTTDVERIKFSGASSLVIKDNRILGLQISELDLESIAQDITGTLSMVAGAPQWLTADLHSDHLNLSKLIELMPKSGESDKHSGESLAWIKEQTGVALSLDASTVTLMDVPLDNVKFKLASEPGKLSIDRLNFTAMGGEIKSKGNIAWVGNTAQLDLQANILDFDLDSFLIENPDIGHEPVSGSLSVQSSGKNTHELLAGLRGDVNLQSENNGVDAPPAQRRRLVMKAERTEHGMRANIDSFQWADSELSGEFSFTDTPAPMIELNISDGRLSLLPWENSLATPPKAKDASKTDTGIAGAAKASASFVGRVLMMPARLVTGPEEASKDDKIFSATPLPLDWMKRHQAKVSGKLRTIQSSAGNASDIHISALLDSGNLTLDASAAELNYGSGELHLLAETSATPPTAEITLKFQDVRSGGNKDSFPRSGFTALTSKGSSIAELAANANGVSYLSLGKGPLDYGRMVFLAADLTTTVFQTLIPGIEKKQPQLNCGVTMMVFKDGKGVTPYSFAAQTPEANLAGRMEVDLKTEMLQLEFSSSSRSGLGLSVGNVFSNTIKVSGPLSKPEIVPDTTSILWRGWAAFMTGGLSIVGESVLKRALVSEDPCESVNKHIRKDICGSDSAAAKSALICPAA
jgi:hypothetical protein